MQLLTRELMQMSPPSVHRSEQQFLVSQESFQQSLRNQYQVYDPYSNKDFPSYPSSNKDQVLNSCGNKDTLSYPSSNKDQVLNLCGNKDTHNDLRSNQDQVNSPCGSSQQHGVDGLLPRADHGRDLGEATVG
ncbi:hypothetical protein ACLKA7_014654 [Drosophila subpalustris]